MLVQRRSGRAIEIMADAEIDYNSLAARSDLVLQVNRSHLDRLEDFTSTFGANFYGLPLNEGTIELVREPFVVPEIYAAAGEGVRPAEAGNTLSWRVTV